MRELHDTFDLALDLIVNMSGNVNVYDITKYKDYPVELIGSFLESPDNKKRFGLNDDVEFGLQSGNVYEGLYEDFMRQYVHLVESLLEEKVNVIIYNGQNDFVVNTAGVLNYLNSLNWEGISYWKRSRKEIWTVHGIMSGWAKVYNNLWFVLVNSAGHMVPTDQPEAAFNLLGHFVFDHRDWKE